MAARIEEVRVFWRLEKSVMTTAHYQSGKDVGLVSWTFLSVVVILAWILTGASPATASNFTADCTGDTADVAARACTLAANDCSLRGRSSFTYLSGSPPNGLAA